MARRSATRLRAALIAGAALVVCSPSLTAAQPGAASPRALVSAAPDDVAHGQIRFRSFGPADGLHNLVAVAITQDAAGMLWIATDDGVYRYDGQKFTHYTTRDGLPALAVRVLGIAPDGAVCAGTRTGLACWDGSRFSTRGAEGVPSEWVQALVAGPGALWAGTSVGLFVRRGGGRFERAPGSPAGVVKAIWADAQGVVIGDGAALQVSTGDGRWRRLGAEVGLDRERIDAVLRDRDGALWIRSLRHLWILRPGSAFVEDWTDGLPAGSDRGGVACGMVISAWGDVLVGSERGIAYRRDGAWRLIDDSVGLPAREARALFVDREGTVWIGSLGVFQWMGRGLITRHDAGSGLPSDVVWSIARDRDGVLWAGTGDCLARVQAGRWECLEASRGASVRAFEMMPDGGIFLGGGSPDLRYIDPAGQPHTFALAGDRVADRNIYALARTGDGDLWIATTAGLFRLAGAVPGVAERVAVPGSRDDTRYISLLVIGDQLWVASGAGLAVLDRTAVPFGTAASPGSAGLGDHGSWRVFDGSSGLRAAAVRHLLRRRDGRICVSYTDVDGITCFRSDGTALLARQDITLADGLTSGRIYFLGEDRAQRLWIGSGDGVDVVTADGVDHFDESDGLVGNDSSARAFFEDGDGSVWLGASGGVSHVRAQHYRGPPSPPRTALLSGTLGGQPLPAAAGTVRLPHDRSAVNVSFAADGFLNPRRVEFQVRMSPLESEWSATQLREARYPALPPGNYRLEIRARTGAGAWGPVTALGVAVLPAWWQTGWFIVFASAGVLACLGGTVTWRHRVLWRRRAHQLHQQSIASFRDLIESMPDLVLVYRGDELVYLNEAARAMLAIVDGAWHGAVLADRLHPDDRAPVAAMFRDAPSGAGSQAQIIEVRIEAGDGGWRDCELSGRRIALGAGPVTVVTGRDVTERQRLRAKLLLSDRMVSLGTLAAGVAHEINNPLAYVTANLEVLAESFAADADASARSDSERRACIDDARDGAERVRKIVSGLRTFGRYEEDKRRPLALAEVIEAALRLTANELKHRAVVVRELARCPEVIADEARLAQVLINLLNNAAQAIPVGHTDENRITVRTRTDDQGRAVVEVEDTGTGMPPEVRARAFDPFFTTKSVGEGTGLGLSICHSIVTGLGGQIAIDGARPHGTILRVTLPPAPASTTPEPVVASATDSESRRRPCVLIIDDDRRVATALKRVLGADHDVTLASCGAEAIEQVSAGVRYDAIITDVMMPNMTGLELYERLDEIAPGQATRMIFLTGGAFTAQTHASLEATGNPQLQKPVSSQDLRACVARLVARDAAG